MNPEAIEAVAKAIWEASGHNPGDWIYMAPETERPQRYKAYAKSALEAAAPYLLREARAAELEAVAGEYPVPHANLVARAAAIRAGETE